MPAQQRPRSALSPQEDSDSPIVHSDSGSISSQIFSPHPQSVPSPSSFNTLPPSCGRGSGTFLSSRDLDIPALPPGDILHRETEDRNPQSLPPGDVTNLQTPSTEIEDSLRSQRSLNREALSAAVKDLLKRCVFVAAVTQDYRWSGGSTGPNGEFSVKVG